MSDDDKIIDLSTGKLPQPPAEDSPAARAAAYESTCQAAALHSAREILRAGESAPPPPDDRR